MDIKIRQETSTDYKAVFKLIEEAFENEALSDFVPELSLVAEVDDEIAGYILLTKIKIKSEKDEFGSLALAPVAVLPKFQKKGIGGMLINKAHKIAKSLDYKSIILLGHEKYYPRFGYLPVDQFGIELPFDAPKENCMAVELIENALSGISGMVKYPKEFDG